VEAIRWADPCAKPLNFVLEAEPVSDEDETEAALRRVVVATPVVKKVLTEPEERDFSSSEPSPNSNSGSESDDSADIEVDPHRPVPPVPAPPHDPPPPVPLIVPKAPPLLPAVKAKAKAKAHGREDRFHKWGKFTVSEYWPGGVFRGWGVRCGQHTNDGQATVCGRNLCPNDDSTRRYLLAWLNAGADVIDDGNPAARTEHMRIVPKELPLRTDAELERDRVRLWGS